jgi:hypothetical protein
MTGVFRLVLVKVNCAFVFQVGSQETSGACGLVKRDLLVIGHSFVKRLSFEVGRWVDVEGLGRVSIVGVSGLKEPGLERVGLCAEEKQVKVLLCGHGDRVE